MIWKILAASLIISLRESLCEPSNFLGLNFPFQLDQLVKKRLRFQWLILDYLAGLLGLNFPFPLDQLAKKNFDSNGWF